jgi:SMI1 / KNR4 family (SUKH-1)
MPFPTIESFVRRAETELHCVLPEEYRALTLASNGGELSAADDDCQVFPVFDDTDRTKAVRSASHIVRETSAARQWRGFPVAGVAFAANGRGDLLVFLPDEDRPGVLAPAVYLWDHETAKVTCIAASLSRSVRLKRLEFPHFPERRRWGSAR